ncbi:MAG: superinfection immunity protein, partial [Candidatus Binataceae bacterium]
MDALIGLIVIFLSVALYFVPSVIARAREHQNSGAIFVLNLLLGWTFLGWVIALVWAFTAVDDPSHGSLSDSSHSSASGTSGGLTVKGIVLREPGVEDYRQRSSAPTLPSSPPGSARPHSGILPATP